MLLVGLILLAVAMIVCASAIGGPQRWVVLGLAVGALLFIVLGQLGVGGTIRIG